MRKTGFTLILIVVLFVICKVQLNGQIAQQSKVEFLNAPVLFKEGGKSFQQVVASYRSDTVRKDCYY